MKHYNIPIFVVHYGCPHMCVFCNQKKISGCDQSINVEFVIKTIKENLSTMPNDGEIEVAFFGGSFTAIPFETQKKFLECVQPFIKEKKISGIRLSTRPDYMNKEIVDFLYSYNVTTVELGAQSFDENVLKISERGHTANDIRNASKIIKNRGIKLGLQIMPGLPGSSTGTDISDAKEVVKLKPDMVRIYPTLVIKDTKLADMYIAGNYIPMSIEEAVNRVVKTNALMEKNNIRVIRVGLQPSEDIRTEGVIISGPFHPSFRELVESELFFRFFQEKMKEKDKLEVYINIYDVSRAKGIKKSNIKRFADKLDIKIDKSLIKGEMVIDNILFTREDMLNTI